MILLQDRESVLEHDPSQEEAWPWLASVVEQPEEARACLTTLLHLNPQHAQAQLALAEVMGRGR